MIYVLHDVIFYETSSWWSVDWPFLDTFDLEDHVQSRLNEEDSEQGRIDSLGSR